MRQSPKLAALVLVSSCLWFSGCATTSANSDQAYAQAKQDFAAKNYESAFKGIQEPAKAGDADAEYALGYMYFYGKGVAENRQAAEYWFSRAAAHGQVEAQKALALIKKS